MRLILGFFIAMYFLVPSVPVPNVVINDMQAVDWWSISWGSLPSDKINGILRGYRLVYYMSYKSGIPVAGEPKRIVYDFDKFTFYFKASKLLNYATYNVTVTGYTTAGNGPTPEKFASKVIFTTTDNELFFAKYFKINNQFLRMLLFGEV